MQVCYALFLPQQFFKLDEQASVRNMSRVLRDFSVNYMQDVVDI
jgi:hypothetical protein